VTSSAEGAFANKSLRTVAGLYAFSWLLPAFVGGYALYTMFEFQPTTVPDYVPAVHSGLVRYLLDPWQHWDGQWYLRIAERGYYADDASAAFLPAYPSVIHIVSFLTFGDALLAGCLVSWASFAGALVLLAAIFRDELGDEYAVALLLVVAFPTAFFFHAVYTESFFLLCTLAAFFAARRGHFVIAGAAALVATLTRWTGFVLAPVLLVEAWAMAHATNASVPERDVRLGDLVHGSGLESLRRARPARLLASLAPLAALPIVNSVLESAISDPWGFDRAQHLWERRLAPPWTGLIEGVTVLLPGHEPYLDPLPGGFPRLPEYLGGFLQAHAYNLLAAISGLVLAGLAVKRLRASSAAYALAGMVLPLMTPSRLQPLQSMPRFLVVLFPLFAVLAILLRGKPLLTACTVAAFAMIQGFFAARFALWFWVA